MNQAKQFNKVMNKSIEKECRGNDCSAIVIHPKQLCEPCRVKNLNERRRKDRESRRQLRVCKHIDCDTNLDGYPNSTKYCSDKCRPKKQVTAKRLIDNTRKAKKPKKEKSYGLNPMFKNPRGSKQRKELGLPEVKYSNHYGGYSTVD